MYEETGQSKFPLASVTMGVVLFAMCEPRKYNNKLHKRCEFMARG